MTETTAAVFKELFSSQYFVWDSDARPERSRDLAALLQRWHSADRVSYYNYLLNVVRLNNMVAYETNEAKAKSFEFVKPQFKYLKHSIDSVVQPVHRPYLQNGTIVYATNAFTHDPDKTALLPTFMRHIDGARAYIGPLGAILNGRDGFIFAPPYVDWRAVDYCEGGPVSQQRGTPLRLYLMGTFANHFMINDIQLVGMELINYHKGTMVRRPFAAELSTGPRTEFVNYDTFVEAVTRLMRDTPSVLFIQRDYIHDTGMDDPFDKTLDSVCPVTSLVTQVERLGDEDESASELHGDKTVVVDLFCRKFYRVSVNSPLIQERFPVRIHSVLLAQDDGVLIEGTKNAFFGRYGVAILQNRRIFGSTSAVEFAPTMIYEEYRRAAMVDCIHVVNEFYLMYVKKYQLFMLIRSATRPECQKNIADLNNPSVMDTVLKLLVPRA